ncbi:MAG: CDP-archaeol synthase [Desulfosarcinaceae bacterium]|jgi:predicted MPP superfamily phosphohydrolase
MFALKILVILIVANTAPILSSALFPKARRWPLDNGRRLADGRPLLGAHKTLWGLLSGIGAAGIIGLLMGLSLATGLLIGLASLLGDLLTSFFKRRLGLVAGETAHLFDHLLEGALPLLLCKRLFMISWSLVLVLLGLFIASGLLGSNIARQLFPARLCPIRKLRTVRSSASFRQWRACHTALSPLARLLNFENVIYYRYLIKGAFMLLGLYRRGMRNALDLRLTAIQLAFDNLPSAFDGYRILFMSDLHLDGQPGLCRRLIERVKELGPDVCFLGGDYRMEMYGSFKAANRRLDRLVRHIRTSDGLFGILGNHDCIEMAPDLEDSRICMLINESVTIDRDDQALNIVGVDDPHYYQCHDMEKAFSEISPDGFTILLAHSPEIIADMAGRKVDLCLCGHTHAGQIRLPRIGPLFTHCRAPRKYVSGLWRHNGTVGYTSAGAGASGVPVRFNCPPEVVLLTLTRGQVKRTAET